MINIKDFSMLVKRLKYLNREEESANTHALCFTQNFDKDKKNCAKKYQRENKSIKIMKKLTTIYTLSFLQIRFLRDTRRINRYPQTRIGV